MDQRAVDTDFSTEHPHAMHANLASLYRYQPILTTLANSIPELKETAIGRLRTLFVDQWLYHGLPSQMNDPFEARPHFQWPTSPHEAKEQRQHLLKLAKAENLSFKQRQKRVSEIMANPAQYIPGFQAGLNLTFEQQRLCCFTELSNDLLFWSHYADSHRGMCLEFDATRDPIGRAYRVCYRDEYPTVKVSEWKENPLRAILTKSPDWAREREYRSLLIKDTTDKLLTVDPTGSFIQIPSCALTGVYFGAETSEEDKRVVLDLISEGPFNPSIYHGQLSPNSYKVVFSQH